MATPAAAAGGTTSGPQTAEEGGIEVTETPPEAVAGGGADLPQEGAAAEVRGEGVQEREGAEAGGAGEAGGGDESRPRLTLHLFARAVGLELFVVR